MDSLFLIPLFCIGSLVVLIAFAVLRSFLKQQNRNKYNERQYGKQRELNKENKKYQHSLAEEHRNTGQSYINWDAIERTNKSSEK